AEVTEQRGSEFMTDVTTARKRPKPATAGKSKVHAVPHFTPAERVARGKAERAEVPRSTHAEWEPPSNRRNPVDLLEEQAKSRVQELVPIRYGRMLTSAFAFFRGGAYVMAADLAVTPRTGLHAQLCGDAHLSNFGSFAAPDRTIVFSVNDFDETLPGPFEWDVKRMAASFEVAGRERGFDDVTRRTALLATVRSYREAMAEFAAMRDIDIWYTRLDMTDVMKRWSTEVTAKELKQFDRDMESRHTKDNIRALSKLTYLVDGEHRIISDPPLIVPIEDVLPEGDHLGLVESMQQFLRTYRQSLPHDRRKLLERYRYVHAARKVVGVGSVGERAWILFLQGRDENDPLFLQFKEAEPSVLEPFLGKSEFAQHGERVVEGQRMIQAASDVLLGWDRVMAEDGVERDYYVRQLWDAKSSAHVELMPPHLFEIYGEVCGWTLAKAHARSGDAIAISAYLGKGSTFDVAMASFSEAYADQNERDYKTVQDAVRDGRLTAHMGL
ncbi:MAG TPA: DUF2252 domain-containing protein, partial [Gaiellaceae bacterium]|nr:DUF2252 domain-containing protein [Gaiellaceae bacterium]